MAIGSDLIRSVKSGPGPWRLAGACSGSGDPQLWYPEGDGPQFTRQIQRAKLACAGCPVRPECRAHAFEVNEEHGIWGGLTEQERRSIRRARATARAAARQELTNA
jgi:WhiB family transcriptional regulator, redox-sensing transcriptional regulator